MSDTDRSKLNAVKTVKKFQSYWVIHLSSRDIIFSYSHIVRGHKWCAFSLWRDNT